MTGEFCWFRNLLTDVRTGVWGCRNVPTSCYFFFYFARTLARRSRGKEVTNFFSKISQNLHADPSRKWSVETRPSCDPPISNSLMFPPQKANEIFRVRSHDEVRGRRWQFFFSKISQNLHADPSRKWSVETRPLSDPPISNSPIFPPQKANVWVRSHDEVGGREWQNFFSKISQNLHADPSRI